MTSRGPGAALCEAALLLLLIVTPLYGQQNSQASSGSEGGSSQSQKKQLEQSSKKPNSNEKPAVQPGPAAPGAPQIMLPNVVLQVPDIAAASVKPFLPQAQALSVPDTGVPLPDQGALHVPDQAFEIPLPGKQQTAAARPSGSSLYNTGSLGAGSMNHVVGSLSLYKLGDSPRIHLHFLHEGLDGFAGNDAGTGFFSTSNDLSGSVSTGDAKLGSDSSASYHDENLGLQKQSPLYYSVDLRTISGSAGLSYSPNSLWSFNGKIEANAASRLYTVAVPAQSSNPAEWAYTVAPSVSAGLSLSQVTFQLRGAYNLRLTDGLSPLNTANIGLFADATLPADFLLKADLGAFWTIGSGFRYPFSIDLAKSIGNELSLNLSGGYSITPLDYTDLWAEYPLLHVGSIQSGSLVNGDAWYGKAGFAWSTADLLFTTQGSIKLAYREHVIDITGYSTAESTYFYEQNDYLTLQPQLQITWSPISLFSLSAGFQGNLLQKAEQEPWAAFNMRVSATSPGNRFGGGITGTFSIFDTPAMPLLSANLFFRVTEGVELDLDAQDMLAPLISTGRPVIGAVQSSNFPFIAPGFRVTLSTHISL